MSGMQKKTMSIKIKKSVTTISGNKITDLLLSPAKHRLDDSAVFQPHKSREDSKINSYEWVECKENFKKICNDHLRQ